MPPEPMNILFRIVLKPPCLMVKLDSHFSCTLFSSMLPQDLIDTVSGSPFKLRKWQYRIVVLNSQPEQSLLPIQIDSPPLSPGNVWSRNTQRSMTLSLLFSPTIFINRPFFTLSWNSQSDTRHPTQLLSMSITSSSPS